MLLVLSFDFPVIYLPVPISNITSQGIPLFLNESNHDDGHGSRHIMKKIHTGKESEERQKVNMCFVLGG